MATFGQIPSNVNFNNFQVVTSATRPSSPAEGDNIYETDTDKVLVWDGSAWKQAGGKRTSEIWMDNSNFIAAVGGPTRTLQGSWGNVSVGWNLPDGGVTAITAVHMLPPEWDSGTVNFDVFYRGGGAGSFVMEFSASSMTSGAPGDNTEGPHELSTRSTITSANGLAIKIDALSTALTVTAGDLLKVSIARDPTDAADNTSNGMVVFGIRAKFTAWM